MKASIVSVLFSLLIVSLFPLVAAGDVHEQFSKHWFDGRAELDGYKLTVSRYGQAREGTCVMVYVTEPFSKSKNVKVEDHTRNPSDTFQVLKLNLVRDFQTGIYDYNTMVSTFVRTDDFSPVKVTFTSAEWCGHVYEELVFNPDKISGHYYSYFENESGPVDIDNRDGGVAEDNLFILLRGLRGDYLEPGEKRSMELLPSTFFSRLAHKKQGWTKTMIERLNNTERITVPAGEFETIVYKISGDRSGTFYMESDYPHRIVRWEMLPDVRGELTGSKRLPYWQLNNNGNESYLKELGL